MIFQSIHFNTYQNKKACTDYICYLINKLEPKNKLKNVFFDENTFPFVRNPCRGQTDGRTEITFDPSING